MVINYTWDLPTEAGCGTTEFARALLDAAALR